MDAIVTIRLAPELWFFVSPDRRREQFSVRHDGSASLGHVIEALNVPLTEVGILRADGRPVDTRHRPQPDSVIEVQPIERPQRIPGWSGGFTLDVHLGTLARRLRVLGIDTVYRNDADDDDLVRQANTDGRVLLTKDRMLLKRRSLRAGAYVRGDRPAEQLADVLDRFAPPLRPWSRCPHCNELVEPVAKDEVAHLLLPGTRRSYQQFAQCRCCGRVYWPGAHRKRLNAIVEQSWRTFRGDMYGTS